MTRAEIRRSYNVDSTGICRAPGKFEGEPLYAPYFWFLALDGTAECDEDGSAFLFDITPEDVALFPELGAIKRLAIQEDDNGFVYSSVVSDEGRWCSAIPAELMVE